MQQLERSAEVQQLERSTEVQQLERSAEVQQLEKLRQQINEMWRLRVDWSDSQRAEGMMGSEGRAGSND